MFQIPVTFYYENHVPAYAALELPKTQYQFVDACATPSAASLWTADECAADVVNVHFVLVVLPDYTHNFKHHEQFMF